MRVIYLLVILCSFSFISAISSSSAIEDSIYISKELKFKITPPIIENKPANAYVAHFFLPADKGFAPNVNVMLQEYKDTIAEYEKLSQKQFIELKYVVIKSELKGNMFSCEYTGIVNKLPLHFYVRAFKIGDSIYLTTATSLEEQWEKSSPALIKSVDSFQINK